MNMEMNSMRYPAHFEQAPEGGYVVTFRDIPEAITQGDTESEALEMAADALLTAMDFYFEDRRQVPHPSRAHKGERYIELPPSVWAKVLLLNEMVRQGVTASDLARRLHTSPQNINRVIDLEHSTKIDTLSDAFQALGRQLELKVA
jgi:antitoxin HicB